MRPAWIYCLVACSPTLFGQTNVLTWHNDNARTGQNLEETILTPANVAASKFGLLFTLAVDGKVDAQPLFVPALAMPGVGVHNVLYVATEHDSVYAFDADQGTLLKQVSLLDTNETPSDNRGCNQVTPEIGITATPVVDPQSGQHGTIYMVAMTKDHAGKYHHWFHALDLTTLAEEFGGPVEIAASYPGTGVETTFQPAMHKERAALLLLNGVVYTSWSSHCDAGSYTSWLIGYSEATLQQVTVLNLTPNGGEGAMWAGGSGPAADAAGNLYVPTGNGTFGGGTSPPALNSSGFPADSDYGNAFLKLSTSSGKLAVVDYFSMSNTVSESRHDTDLASGGGMLLPPLNDGQGNSRDLAVVAGKDSNLYVVDRNNFGKYHNPDALYQELGGVLAGGVWSSPAWFNGTLYYGPQGNVLKAFSFANGLLGMNPASQTSVTFPYPGTTPSISADGISNGIVWAVQNSSPAVLHAYNANNLGDELYNSNQASNRRDQFGDGNKFIVPTVVSGKVYVGTTKGVGVFGLLVTSATAAISPLTRNVTIGDTTSYTITVTGTRSFQGTVNFSVTGLPAGMTGTFQPSSVVGSGSATLTIRATTGASTGTFTAEVIASGAINETLTASLTVIRPSASFVKLDTSTQGNWHGVYGSAGYLVIGDQTLNPTFVTPQPHSESRLQWESSTTDVRGLQKPSNLSSRIAAGWSSASLFTVDLNYTDTATHLVEIYSVDWIYSSKRQRVDILDPTGNVLATYSLTGSFHSGVYLQWQFMGHVKIRVTRTAGSLAVVSGLFSQ